MANLYGVSVSKPAPRFCSGDISAHRPGERVVCILIMLAGSYIFALVMGTIASIIMEGNEAKLRFRCATGTGAWPSMPNVRRYRRGATL